MRLSIIPLALALLVATGCGNKKNHEHAGTSAEHAGAATGSTPTSATSTTSTAPAKEHAGKEHAGKETEHAGKEHAGKEKEHAGKEKEHAGKEKEHAGKEKEHAGKEHGGAKAPTFNAEQIKAAMNEHIKTQTAKNAGVLKIKDEKTSEELSLEFVKIHDPVRVIEGKGYFACTDFKPKGDTAGKLYDLDFWLSADASGKLAVFDTKIHKHPELGADKKWTKKERYTFINDNPVEVK